MQMLCIYHWEIVGGEDRQMVGDAGIGESAGVVIEVVAEPLIVAYPVGAVEGEVLELYRLDVDLQFYKREEEELHIFVLLLLAYLDEILVGMKMREILLA